MKKINSQKGAVSAIIVFVLIVVISSMVGISLTMSRSSLSDANMRNSAIQASYLAESALERVVYNLNTTPACTSLVTPDQQTLNNGTFETVSASISPTETDDTECDIKVKGSMNGIVKFIDTKVFNFGGTGGGGAGANYTETFPSNVSFNANWAIEVNTATQGLSQWVSANCNATCLGTAGTGSFYAEANGSGNNRTFTGYRETTITTINSGAAGLTLDLTGGFKKDSSGGNPNRQTISIELIETTGATTVLWSDATRSSANVWIAIATSTALPANRSYDRLRIRYNLRGASYLFWGAFPVETLPYVWVDEINISGGAAGGPAPDWQVVEWQEVSQ